MDSKTATNVVHPAKDDGEIRHTDTKASSIQADWTAEEEKRAKRKYV